MKGNLSLCERLKIAFFFAFFLALVLGLGYLESALGILPNH